ncbi:unnamed protein product [Ambrosiozyma monospora]|uniref:Unnamed protein product n=1 Tax=Ambrosiozyma monospora TaxID=43982 RepID=A0A9W6YZ37_AMBMO|nr:unnamed protein product [Ambrosiozyma monospora]
MTRAKLMCALEIDDVNDDEEEEEDNDDESENEDEDDEDDDLEITGVVNSNIDLPFLNVPPPANVDTPTPVSRTASLMAQNNHRHGLQYQDVLRPEQPNHISHKEYIHSQTNVNLNQGQNINQKLDEVKFQDSKSLSGSNKMIPDSDKMSMEYMLNLVSHLNSRNTTLQQKLNDSQKESAQHKKNFEDRSKAVSLLKIKIGDISKTISSSLNESKHLHRLTSNMTASNSEIFNELKSLRHGVKRNLEGMDASRRNHESLKTKLILANNEVDKKNIELKSLKTRLDDVSGRLSEQKIINGQLSKNLDETRSRMENEFIEVSTTCNKSIAKLNDQLETMKTTLGSITTQNDDLKNVTHDESTRCINFFTEQCESLSTNLNVLSDLTNDRITAFQGETTSEFTNLKGCIEKHGSDIISKTDSFDTESSKKLVNLLENISILNTRIEETDKVKEAAAKGYEELQSKYNQLEGSNQELSVLLQSEKDHTKDLQSKLLLADESSTRVLADMESLQKSLREMKSENQGLMKQLDELQKSSNKERKELVRQYESKLRTQEELLKLSDAEVKIQKDKQTEEYQKLQESLHAKTNLADGLNHELKTLKKNLSDLSKRTQNELNKKEAKINVLSESVESKDNAISKLKDDISELHSQQKQFLKDLTKLEHDARVNQDSLLNSDKSKEVIRKKLEDSEAELTTKKKAIKALQQELQEVRNELKNTDASADTFKRDIRIEKEKLAEKDKQIEALQSELDTTKNSLLDTDKTVSSSRKELTKLKKELTVKEKQISSMESKLEEAEIESLNKMKSGEKIKKELHIREVELTRCKDKVKMLQHDLKESKKSVSNSDKAVMELKKDLETHQKELTDKQKLIESLQEELKEVKNSISNTSVNTGPGLAHSQVQAYHRKPSRRADTPPTTVTTKRTLTFTSTPKPKQKQKSTATAQSTRATHGKKRSVSRKAPQPTISTAASTTSTQPHAGKGKRKLIGSQSDHLSSSSRKRTKTLSDDTFDSQSATTTTTTTTGGATTTTGDTSLALFDIPDDDTPNLATLRSDRRRKTFFKK